MAQYRRRHSDGLIAGWRRYRETDDGDVTEAPEGPVPDGTKVYRYDPDSGTMVAAPYEPGREYPRLPEDEVQPPLIKDPSVQVMKKKVKDDEVDDGTSRLNQQMMLTKKQVELTLAERLSKAIQQDRLVGSIDACKGSGPPRLRVETAKDHIKNTVKQTLFKNEGRRMLRVEIYMGNFMRDMKHSCEEQEVVVEGKSVEGPKLTKEIKVTFPENIEMEEMDFSTREEEQTVVLLAPLKVKEDAGYDTDSSGSSVDAKQKATLEETVTDDVMKKQSPPVVNGDVNNNRSPRHRRNKEAFDALKSWTEREGDKPGRKMDETVYKGYQGPSGNMRHMQRRMSDTTGSAFKDQCLNYESFNRPRGIGPFRYARLGTGPPRSPKVAELIAKLQNGIRK